MVMPALVRPPQIVDQPGDLILHDLTDCSASYSRVDEIWVTRDEFLRMKEGQSAAAAGPPNVALPQEAPSGSSASTGLADADTAPSSTSTQTVPSVGAAVEP